MTTLVAAGQSTPEHVVLARESADYTISTSAGFDGRAWLQERLDDGTWRNKIEVEPGDSATINGPVTVRVWIESMELGDDLTATFDQNDDVLFAVPRADGRIAFSVRSKSGVSGINVGAVSGVNGKVGDVVLTSADVSADPKGAANTAKLEAIAEAQARIDLHKNQVNPHGLTKNDIGLSLVENLAPDSMPVSEAQQTAINNAVAGKLDKGLNDGVIRGVKDGALVTLPSSGSGNTTLKITESDYAALATKDPDVIYVVVADPAPANRIANGDFASGQTGWTIISGTGWTFSGAAANSSSGANTTLAQNVADMASAPAAGTTVNLSYVISGYTEGNVTARVRYTDGTYGNIIVETPASNGTKTGSLTIDAVKVLERFEMRVTQTNAAIGLTIDDIVLT